MESVNSLVLLEGILSKYPVGKETLTNNFLTKDEYVTYISSESLFYISTDNNVCFFVKKETCYRLYYIINSLSEVFDIPIGENYVIEILFRGERFFPQQHISYWENIGFKKHLQRDLYELKKSSADFSLYVPKDLGFEIKKVQTLADAKVIKKLFDSAFDIYTGDYITDNELDQIYMHQQLYVAYKNNKPIAGLHYYIKKNVLWLGHIAVSPEFFGRSIAKELVKKHIFEFKEQDIIRYALWVQTINSKAINLYKSMGYQYIGKSTMSMLKLK